MSTVKTLDVEVALLELEKAVNQGKISADAKKNILIWLTEVKYASYSRLVLEHIDQENWQQLEDVFWTVTPFGTGGRRGCMYPIGSNAINDRTIGESARGLAVYVKSQRRRGESLSCAIAFDTRHNSERFAKLCAEIMVASGFHVYFLDSFRATPELSFLVRQKQCQCGIMITASHNPPSDNAIKCYWSHGGQLLPPHDQGVIQEVMHVDTIPRVKFEQAMQNGDISLCTSEIDQAYTAQVVQQGFDGPRNIKVLYSPLHGVGTTAVCPALFADGFKDIEIYQPHSEPNGDFPNVPGNVSNPENDVVFNDIITHGKSIGADVILATDPDSDRVGCAAPLTLAPMSEWKTLNGNQIGALLADFVLSRRQRSGTLRPNSFIVKTLVTSELIRRIGLSYNVPTQGDLLVGFKWIGGQIDEIGPDEFVFGAEESHGYLVGNYARDKDAASAAMLLAEYTAELKVVGQTLHQRLDSLYVRHGYHVERVFTAKMNGSSGMQKMRLLMHRFRENPPELIGGMRVVTVRDYLSNTTYQIGEPKRSMGGPTGNMVILELNEFGNYIAVRPSGTEPKIKFYPFIYVPADQVTDLNLAKAAAEAKLDQIQNELKAIVELI